MTFQDLEDKFGYADIDGNHYVLIADANEDNVKYDGENVAGYTAYMVDPSETPNEDGEVTLYKAEYHIPPDADEYFDPTVDIDWDDPDEFNEDGAYNLETNRYY